MPGTWSTPIAAPFNVGLMLLLTDGSVLAQNAGTSLWWRLWPDRAGRYAQGEWRSTGASASAPLYFASAVLRDGSVFIAGGEYSNNATQAANLGSVESFDPLSGTWRKLPTPSGWTAIGDAPCCVLADGRLLLGNITAGPCAIWDPAAGAWTATPPKLNGTSSEESWTLLPDGSVLTADCVGQPASERFVGNAWITNGATGVALVEAASSEIGPAVLLPDGTVLALGATGATARFTPAADPSTPGTWTAGPNLPMGAGGVALGAKDAPAVLLPNGRVLCAAGPVDGVRDNYNGPTSFFEFDPVVGTWSAALPAPPGDSGLAPYAFCFLLLPNGQVLASNGTPTLQLYQPDGAPNPAWAPGIQTCPTELQAGTTYRLQGTQLNGLSQACAYGDDAAMATNYPLVRLHAAFPSDSVVYCRTSGHSTMGVATGGALHHTDFTVPASIPAGIYQLSVVANGIASPTRPVVVASRAVPRRPARAPGDAETAAGASTGMFAEEELFLRDLAEVHLLIDYISGHNDKSLADLKDFAGTGADGQPTTTMAPERVIEEICKISYPPEGTLEADARQAAFILLVKDKLNYFADPARGMTVAFTAMFAGVALEYSWSSRISAGLRWVRSCFYSPPAINQRRYFSARAAYPNLEAHARAFRRFYNWLPVLALLLSLFIALTNWDISVTSTVLQQIATADSDYAKQFASDKKILPTTETCALHDATSRDACDAAENARAQRASARASLEQLVGASAHIYHPVALSMRLFGPSASTALPLRVASPAPHEWIVQRSSLEGLTLAVVNGLNSIVIPTMFGLLGTVAGLMRSIMVKMRASVLAPRDHQVAWVAMFLGMAAGLSVGLFFNPNDPTGAIAKGLGSTITVSAAGLSFLAGFGSEAFFTFLDELLVRLMPSAKPGTAAPPK